MSCFVCLFVCEGIDDVGHVFRRHSAGRLAFFCPHLGLVSFLWPPVHGRPRFYRPGPLRLDGRLAKTGFTTHWRRPTSSSKPPPPPAPPALARDVRIGHSGTQSHRSHETRYINDKKNGNKMLFDGIKS